MVGDGISKEIMGKWHQGYDYDPEGDVVREAEITGRWGTAWVTLYDEGGHYTVYISYTDNYQPALGESQSLTANSRPVLVYISIHILAYVAIPYG